MAGAAGFGILIGVFAMALTKVMPGDLGWAVFWACVAVQLAVAAFVTWRRTRLLLSSVAMGFGSLFSLTVVSLTALGFGWPDLLRVHWVIVGPALLVGPVLLLIEARFHRAEWQRWREYMDSCSLLDLLALRHIPDWRGPIRPRDRRGA